VGRTVGRYCTVHSTPLRPEGARVVIPNSLWDASKGYELGNPGFITTLYVNA